MECNIFPSVLWHCWLGDRKGIRPVKYWVLVCWWWWFDWRFARLIAPVVTTTSTILCFNEHRLTQVHLEKRPLKWREKWPLQLRFLTLICVYGKIWGQHWLHNTKPGDAYGVPSFSFKMRVQQHNSFYNIQKWNSWCWTIIHGLSSWKSSITAIQTDFGDGVSFTW